MSSVVLSQEQRTALKTHLEATKAQLEAQDFTNMTKDDILGDLLYTTAFTRFSPFIEKTWIGV